MEEVKEEFLHRHRLVAKLRTFLHFFLVFLDIFYSFQEYLVLRLDIKTEKEEQFSRKKCYQGAVGDTTPADDIIESQIAEREDEEEAAKRIFSSYEYVHPHDFLTASHCDKSPKKSHLEILFKFMCAPFFKAVGDFLKS